MPLQSGLGDWGHMKRPESWPWEAPWESHMLPRQEPSQEQKHPSLDSLLIPQPQVHMLKVAGPQNLTIRIFYYIYNLLLLFFLPRHAARGTSATRGWTLTLHSGSMESQSLDHEGSPKSHLLKKKKKKNQRTSIEVSIEFFTTVTWKG